RALPVRFSPGRSGERYPRSPERSGLNEVFPARQKGASRMANPSASLKAMLKENRVLVGMTMQHVTGAWLARLYKNSGADFVCFESEPGFSKDAALADSVPACRFNGLPVVAKVPECSRTHVAKLLECGVVGIQLPWTETREQIDRLVSYVKFPPDGIRAVAPGMGNCDYNLQTTGRELIDTGNRETVVLAHVET